MLFVLVSHMKSSIMEVLQLLMVTGKVPKFVISKTVSKQDTIINNIFDSLEVFNSTCTLHSEVESISLLLSIDEDKLNLEMRMKSSLSV